MSADKIFLKAKLLHLFVNVSLCTANIRQDAAFLQERLESGEIGGVAFHWGAQENIVACVIALLYIVACLIDNPLSQSVIGGLFASGMGQDMYIRIIFFQSPGNGTSDQSKPDKAGCKCCFHNDNFHPFLQNCLQNSQKLFYYQGKGMSIFSALKRKTAVTVQPSG